MEINRIVTFIAYNGLYIGVFAIFFVGAIIGAIITRYEKKKQGDSYKERTRVERYAAISAKMAPQEPKKAAADMGAIERYCAKKTSRTWWVRSVGKNEKKRAENEAKLAVQADKNETEEKETENS